MKISVKDDTDINMLVSNIDAHFNLDTRFKCEVEHKGRVINVRNVRLKESKRYCGSHPYACDIEGGRKGNYLEGKDWCEFNDHLNDILDSLSCNANVRSAVCIIRKGTRRRTYYDGFMANPYRNEYQWNLDTDDCYYEDYCGQVAPKSQFPEGTPGLYMRGEKV